MSNGITVDSNQHNWEEYSLMHYNVGWLFFFSLSNKLGLIQLLEENTKYFPLSEKNGG